MRLSDYGRTATTDKIRSFKQLKKGWSYGEGVPFKDSMLNDAISLIREANVAGFYRTNAFPGLNGEVMCTIYHKEHYLEFSIEIDGSVVFCREDGDDEVCYQEKLSLNDAKQNLNTT